MKIGDLSVQINGSEQEFPVWEIADVPQDNLRVAVDGQTGSIPLVPTGDPRGSGVHQQVAGTTYEWATKLFNPEHILVLHGADTDEWNYRIPDTGAIDRTYDTARDYGSYIDDLVYSPVDGTAALIQEDTVYHLDKDGTELWTYSSKYERGMDLAFTRSGALLATWQHSDHQVPKGEVVCFERDGSVRWRLRPNHHVSGVTVDSSNNVYTVYSGHAVHRRDPEDGFSDWTNQEAPTDSYGSVVVGSNGNVYVGDASNSQLYEFTSGGDYLGEVGTPFKVSHLRSAPNGLLVGVEYKNDRLYCVDTAGTTQWTHTVSSGMAHQPHCVTPASDGNVYVYVGTWSGLEYADISIGTFSDAESSGIYDAVATEWGLHSTFNDIW